MNKLIVLIVLLVLTGCGWLGRGSAYITGYTVICVTETNVQYVQFPSGVAVLVNQAGHPVACD